MFNFPISDLVALLGTMLLLPLVWIMHSRGQRKSFPCFFLYLVVVLFKAETLIIIRPFYPVLYFYAYWVADAATVLLSFSVIFEIYRHIASSSSLPVSKTTFFRINAGLFLFAAIVASFTIHSAPAHPLMRTEFILSGALRMMQLGFFALLAVLSIFYGFFWTTQAFGIALGYGIYALVHLANTLVRASVGVLGNQIYEYVTMLAYDCALLIWLVYTLKPVAREIHLEKIPENNTAIWFGALERLGK